MSYNHERLLADALAIVRELAEDEVINHCADEGNSCAFCHQPVHRRGMWTSFIEHEKDCLWSRASRLVNSVEFEKLENGK